MKLKLFILLTFISSIAGLSQSFAPVGAKWHYTEGQAFSGYISYLTITVTKDTIISGRNCVQIESDYLACFPYGTLYVSTSNDSVFFFDQELGDFKTIYVFNAMPGDHWTIPIKGDMYEYDYLDVSVNSIGTRIVNNKELNVQYVTYTAYDYDEFGNLSESFGNSSEIVEFLGDLTFLFFFPTTLSYICDDNYSGGLRCYEDNYIGHYETGIASSCTYSGTWEGVNDPRIGTLGLHPNPSIGNVYFESFPDQTRAIDLIDHTGRVVKKFMPSEEINLTGLPGGVYFLRIIDSQNVFYIEKVIKHGI
jgi:hypothetical protein